MEVWTWKAEGDAEKRSNEKTMGEEAKKSKDTSASEIIDDILFDASRL